MKNNIIKLILAIGFITLSSAISAQKQRIDSLVIKNGSQGLNKVLVCDTNGNATWSANSDAAWFNTNTNTGATKVNDTMYHTGNISIGNAVTNPDSSQIRLGNNWRNTLNVNTTLTNYSKLVNNGVYAGMLLGNNAAKSTGFYDGFHTDLWTATTSTQDIFWMNSLNAYLSHRGTGTVDIAMGAWTPMEVFGTGRITDAYGFRTQALVTGAGSITNSYGLMIENPVLASGGTIANRWGVYQRSTGDKNYFAGRTAIGNASNSPDTAIIYPAAKTINALSIQQNDYTAAEYADRTHLQVMGWNGKFLPTTANKNLYGDNGAVQLEAGTTLNVSVLSGTTSTARNFGTGTVSSIYNFFGSTNRGTGLVSGATGVIGNSNNALSGQITTSRGVWGQSLNQSATSSMVNSIGGQFDVQNQIAGGTVTNAYGVRSTFLTGLGTTTNGYGLYIDSVLATNKWSIYTNSGRASIGDTLQLRTVPTGTASDEILVRRAATGDVYKMSADSISAKSRNYAFLRTSDNLPAETVGDNTVNAYRAGHTAFGNFSTTPDSFMLYGSPAAKVILSAQERLTTDAQYAAVATEGIIGALEHDKPTNYTGSSRAINGLNHTKASSTVNYSNITGVALDASHFGTGTVTNLIGGSAGAFNRGTGTVTTASGLNVQGYNSSTGTVTDLYGVNSIIANTNATGVVTNAYGLRSRSLGTTGVVNGYGLYIDNINATNDWGVYQADPYDYNSFRGRMAIGDGISTTPTIAENPDHLMYNDGTINPSSTALKVHESFNEAFDFAAGRTQSASNFASFLSPPAGAVHVGTRATDARLITDAANAFNYQFLTGNANGVNHFGTGSVLNMTSVTGQTNNSNTGNVNTAMGGDMIVTNASTGTITTAFGTASTIRNNAAGAITTALGSRGITINASTGSMGTAYGTVGALQNNSTGTVTNSYGGFFASQNDAGGTIANANGLRAQITTNQVGNLSVSNITNAIQTSNIYRSNTNATTWSLIEGSGTIDGTGNITNTYAQRGDYTISGTGTYGTVYGSRNVITSNGASGNITNGYAALLQMDYNGGHATQVAYGAHGTVNINAAATGKVNRPTGARFTSEFRSTNASAIPDIMFGVRGSVRVESAQVVPQGLVSDNVALVFGGGTVSTLTGSQSVLALGNATSVGNATNYTAFLSTRANFTGANTVTNAYGFRSDALMATSEGTITNGYGLFLSDIGTGVTNKWGVYQAGTDNRNFFAGATTFSGTDAVTVPSGTTAQRNATPVFGMVRYNSTIGRGEMYVNDLNGDGTQGDAGWRAF